MAESFDLVFQALLKGGGPTEAFKPYLFRTMNAQFGRHWKSRQRNQQLTDTEVEDPDFVGAADRIDSDEQRGAAAQALRSLPERWQQVIVAVDVEGRSVQEVAESFGLTPNSASVLLKRAREGLRKAWLSVMHPARNLPEECTRSVSRFGELRWGKKDTPARLEARAHIDGCDRCDARWVQFRDQAVIVGLVSAGILALGAGAHRRVTVPAVAAVGAAALALSATALIAPLLGADLFPDSSNADRQPPAAPLDASAVPRPEGGNGTTPDGSQSQPHNAAGAAASAPSQADGTGARTADGSTGSNSSGTNASNGAGARTNGNVLGNVSSQASSTSSADGGASSAASSNADADGTSEASNVLYFGDWTDWCEAKQSFTKDC
ncbi:sigma-70 family RNA polymerase sigma factor [Leucobacter salsicius]|uniref:sigma-70 family RNA polymerase sigma factor n=1 Tax=Leucobacter salsicius TaxID=664638 RepID=UPI000345F60C|nr:sigma-70 family RNA polymerase sigma factor [Leucobacter salsicius]